MTVDHRYYRSSVNDHKITKNVYSDKKDTITKKKTKRNKSEKNKYIQNNSKVTFSGKNEKKHFSVLHQKFALCGHDVRPDVTFE